MAGPGRPSGGDTLLSVEYRPEILNPGQPRPAARDGGRQPTLAVVSGRPGAGRSTLARRLADTLRCPMVSRDEINEGICRTVGLGPGPTSTDQVATLTFDTFFRVLALLMAYDVTSSPRPRSRTRSGASAWSRCCPRPT